jgi:hypothetical protein
MGITVYGTSEAAPISDLVIDGNQIFRCQPAQSEALTLNGNVTNFQVSNNVVRDVNNIGIDLIGGERDINPSQVARNGLVRGNTVLHARADYGGGFAAGIYVDGGRDITVEDNFVAGCDLGIEVGAENPGIVASGVVVRNNLIVRNQKAGLVFGGFDVGVGRVEGCSFLNDTVFENDTLNAGQGQLWIQFAVGNVVMNNIFVAARNKVLISSDAGNVNNLLDYNLYLTRQGPEDVDITWNGQELSTFALYRAAAGEDAHGLFADPHFVNGRRGNFLLAPGSPAIDAGTSSPGLFAPFDFLGLPRPQGAAPDIGAYEFPL